MPTEGKKVNVTMELFGDYFLFLHNGKFFDRNDVQAIADAAQSTKSRDKTKTGYKGIGFKSVFTDSSRVYIKSGDYSFKFDKLNPIYQNFWELYGGYARKLSTESKKEFKQEYSGKEEQYIQIERIPWQIKPIWIEWKDLPDILKKSNFKYNHSVAIALDIGQDIFNEKEYDKKITNLLNEPRFLLFLRNLTSLQYKNETNESEYTLVLQQRENQADILLNGNLHSTYTTWENEITISNDDFTEAGLQFQKREIQEGKYEFVDSEGQKIKNIPEKLSFLEKTVLTFAAQTEGAEIKGLPKQDAILFNYLPTSDKRFEFPFLVNGDFVTKTDREFILHENVWNQYLFYHIGYAHIEWLSQLANKRTYQSSYLRLLVHKLKDESHSSEGLINASFNRGIIKAVAELPFIMTNTGSAVRCQDIILDETGISTIFGESFFYAFTSISKKLPNPKIQPKILQREFLGIDEFKVKNLLNCFAQSESLELFTEAVGGLSKEGYLSFLDWLNKLCKDNQDTIGPVISGLPFICLGNQVMSWAAIAKLDTHLLLDDRTEKLREIITALGLISSEASIDKTPALKQALKGTNTYLDTDLLLYSRLSTKCHNCTLTAQQKATLLTFFSKLTQVGEEKYARILCLYTDESGVRRPLEKLINRNLADVPNWFSKYRINELEAALLPSFAVQYLVQEKNLFSKLYCDSEILHECTKELNARNAAEWTNQLLLWRSKDPVDVTSSWNKLPWLYTNDTHRFKAASELWDHPVLSDIKAHAVIERLTGWILPHSESQKIAKDLKLSLRSDRLFENLVPSGVILSHTDAVLFLEFLVKAKEKDFLNKFQFDSVEEGYQLKYLTANHRLYVADKNLHSYVDSSSTIKNLLQFPEGLGMVKGINDLGVLMGNELIEWLVDKDPILTLTPFVAASSDTNLQEKFLKNIKLTLRSEQIYDKESLESQFIRLLELTHSRKSVDANEAKVFIDSIRINITLNGESLDKWRVTDRVRIGKKDTGINAEFNLSELLPKKYKGVSDVANQLIEHFAENRAFIKKELLASRDLTPAEVAKEFLELDFLSPSQVVFRQIQAKVENFVNPFGSYTTFTKYFSDPSKSDESIVACKEYLSILKERDFYESFINFNLPKYVDASVKLDETETLPNYLTEWANTPEHVLFLCKLRTIGSPDVAAGFNGPDSALVKLRKGLLNGGSDTLESHFDGIKQNAFLVENTVKWLINQPDEIVTLHNLPIIKKLLEQTVSLGISNTYLLIVITNGFERSYQIKKWVNEPIHFIRADWGDYTYAIQKNIQKREAWLIDSMTPDLIQSKAKPTDKPFESIIRPNLIELCQTFEAEYYQSWDRKDEYPIYVYKESRFLPYEIWYDGQYIEDDKERNEPYFMQGKSTFLTLEAVSSFPIERPEGMPIEVALALVELKFRSSSVQANNVDTSGPDNVYNPILDKVKQGIELSKEEQKRWHAEAVNRGRNFLIKEGYDFKSVEEEQHPTYGEYHRLVLDLDRETVTVYYRNALGGLLYLNPGLWKKLAERDTVLVVVYEDGEPRAFTTQEELLKEKYNKYMLYRAFNDKQPESVNRIAEKLEDGMGHLLFVTGPNYYKHLYNILKAQPEGTPIDKPLAGLENL